LRAADCYNPAMITTRKRRIIRWGALSMIVLALVVGATTHVWQRTLTNRAARIEIGQSRADVQRLLGSPVATNTFAVRKPGDNGLPLEYVTELYDPIFGAKARVAALLEPLGWFPFDLDQTEFPVHIHYDDDGHVDMIKRGDVVLSK
jgi:hypothetical protein